MSTIQKTFPHGKWVDYDTDSIISGLKSKLEIIAPNHLRIQTVKFQSDYPTYDICYELPGRLGCCSEKKARREKEVRLARLEASRRMVRRGRKVIRDLDRDVLEDRTKNRGFFVGPSSTYHRDCVPRPARGCPDDILDIDDGRIVHANGGVYYVFKLPKESHIDDINYSDEICSISRPRNLYDFPCRAHQITDYQVVTDPVNGYHLKMTKLYDPAGNKLHGRDATWWFRRENADLARTSTVIFSDDQ